MTKLPPTVEAAAELPACPSYMAHPQAVWFEEHWRPLFEQSAAREAALRAAFETARTERRWLKDEIHLKWKPTVDKLRAEVERLRAGLEDIIALHNNEANATTCCEMNDIAHHTLAK